MEHFKLGVQSFGVTPDPNFLYLSNTHREALASLFYGIHAGRGFTALIAAPGMGKTTLLFRLLGLLMADAKTAFLFQTLSGPEEFLRCLLTDLGVDDQGGDVACMQAKLNSYLLQQSINGYQVVVVIDEAQNLDDKVLELVRMLSNFENPGKKLLHLILSGQPQLAQRLSSEHLIQLRQRISLIARLAPFNAAETRAYIEHRLRVAGAAPDNPLFSDEAYATIAQHSGGIPRNINNLCFNSLSLACALKRPQVDELMVQETINDLDLTTITAPKPSGIQPRPWSTLFTPPPSPAVSWRQRMVLVIGLLSALAVVFQPWSFRNDRVQPEHAANAPQQKAITNSEALQTLVTTRASPSAHSRESMLIVETDEETGRNASVPDARPLPGGSRHSQASSPGQSSRSPQALEKVSNASKESSVPFERGPQREKP